VKPVNLLPDEHRPRRAGGERPGSAYAVLGVLAVAGGWQLGQLLWGQRV